MPKRIQAACPAFLDARGRDVDFTAELLHRCDETLKSGIKRCRDEGQHGAAASVPVQAAQHSVNNLIFLAHLYLLGVIADFSIHALLHDLLRMKSTTLSMTCCCPEWADSLCALLTIVGPHMEGSTWTAFPGEHAGEGILQLYFYRIACALEVPLPPYVKDTLAALVRRRNNGWVRTASHF